MNYKLSNIFHTKYLALSYFQQGLFWGIVFSWIAMVSGVSGATMAKILYLDQKKTVVADRDYSRLETALYFEARAFESIDISIETEQKKELFFNSRDRLSLEPNLPKYSLFIARDFFFPSRYESSDELFLQEKIVTGNFLTYVDRFLITDLDLVSINRDNVNREN